MAKKPPKNGEPWTPADKRQLEKLAAENTPTRVMGLKLGRSPAAVQQQASRQEVSLKPTNQRPYGTRKK